MRVAIPTKAIVRENAWPALTAALVAITIIVVLDRSPPVSPENGQVVPQMVQAGQSVTVKWTNDWKRLCPGTVYREFVSDSGVILHITPFEIGVPKSIGPQVFSDRLPIPKMMAEGDASYRASIYFECNFLQHWWPIRVNTPMVTFLVSKPG